MILPILAALAMMAEIHAPAPMLASQLKWQPHFAKHPTDPKVMFTLMSVGGFRAPTSSAHEQLIHEWLAAHPKAIVLKVSDMGSWSADDPNAHSYYVWLVDGPSNLNLHLIEMGDLAGPTMEVPATDKLLIPEAEYAEFIKKAVAAHRGAREKKLGIRGELQQK